jgi:histidinol-phosphate/aromatic aminotransferase/cobyric acid decarboxylase-like protein
LDIQDVKIAKEAMEMQIEAILKEFSDVTGVVVDSAYIDRCDEDAEYVFMTNISL